MWVHFGGDNIGRWRCVLQLFASSVGMRAAIFGVGYYLRALRLKATPCAHRDWLYSGSEVFVRTWVNQLSRFAQAAVGILGIADLRLYPAFRDFSRSGHHIDYPPVKIPQHCFCMWGLKSCSISVPDTLLVRHLFPNSTRYPMCGTYLSIYST
jgi:hypothetical protein